MVREETFHELRDNVIDLEREVLALRRDLKLLYRHLNLKKMQQPEEILVPDVAEDKYPDEPDGYHGR